MPKPKSAAFVINAFRDDALGRGDATEIAARIASGEISPSEAVSAAVERCREFNPKLNALAARTYDDALSRARVAEKKSGGPFAGVPCVIKDNEDVAGVPTRHGSRAVPHHLAAQNSAYVNEILQMGFISLGKSNMPEFGLTATTEPLSHGSAANPWHAGYTTGGSSGGSAALVAAGVVPMGHANDGGGSIRVPASCCGLVGLKPSRGRHPDNPMYSAMPINLVSQGIVTRSVRDTANYYHALEKSYPAPGLAPIGLVEGPGKKRLKIGVFWDNPAHDAVDADVVRVCQQTAEQCAKLGHKVEEIKNPIKVQQFEDFFIYWAMLAFSIRIGGVFMNSKFDSSELEPFTKDLSSLFLRNIFKAPMSVMRLRAAQAEYERLFEQFDIMLTPTLAHPPAQLGHFAVQDDFTTATERLHRWVPFTPPQNVAGAPAVSLPLGESSDGLPIGMQFAGPPGGERTLLEIAFEMEAAMPWPLISNR